MSPSESGQYEHLAPELQTLGGDTLKLWGDREERRGALEALVAAWQTDAPDLQALIARIDRAVSEGLAVLRLPRGPVREIRIEATGRGWQGVKRPDCAIVLDGENLRESVFRLGRPDTVFRVWAHESLHARQPFTANTLTEYRAYPGYEEGMVEGLARRITRDLGGMTPLEVSFGYYVDSYRVLAEVLTVDVEALWRSLWQAPPGAVRAALVNRVVELRYAGILTRASTATAQRRVQAVADRVFSPDYWRSTANEAVLRQLWEVVLQ